MHDDDDTPSPEERREAEALARRLEGEAGAVPQEVLETASLLRAHRQGSDGPTLDPDPERLARLRRQVWQAPRRSSPWPWVLVGSLAFAALLVLVFVPRAEGPPVRPAMSTLVPSPPRSLLEAQTRALARPETQVTEVDAAMVDYRDQVLRHFAESYRRTAARRSSRHEVAAR